MSVQNILILGYGKMGQWFAHQLASEFNTAVLEKKGAGLNGNKGFRSIQNMNEIQNFKPDLVINAVNLELTKSAFNSIGKYLPEPAILADITSIKNGIRDYYKKAGFRFVSTHPMFGPTFGNLENLSNENAIIIEESDKEGRDFFENFYQSLGLKIHFASFEKHDELMAESLSLPFLSTLLFSANTHETNAPGTTWQKHQNIEAGLLSEDDSLIKEVLFNPYTKKKIQEMESSLKQISKFIENKNAGGFKKFLYQLRNKILNPGHKKKKEFQLKSL
jgi:prephenate dehydrogenase